MSRLEDLLNSLPPSIVRGDAVVWLTVTRDTEGLTWTAGYQGVEGGMVTEWFFEGATPIEALEKLAERAEAYRIVERMLRT